MSKNPVLERIERQVKEEFEKTNRILTFDEYLLLVEKNPQQHLRGSAQYLLDMLDHFGRASEKDSRRFCVFDMQFDDPKYKVINQEHAQDEIYRALQGFVREGVNNKLILLHGPNGSAKTSIINCLIRGLEKYSQTHEGAQYRINWIFPVDKIVKGALGLAGVTGPKSNIDSYALLPEEEIACKIPCELKEHPLLLLPLSARHDLIETIYSGKKKPFLPEYLMKGTLSHKSKLILEALLTSYKGDLKKVLMHVQVERFFISKRYRTGAITIEPQMHVDAQTRQISMDRNLTNLPVSLQGVSLHELSGDLVDGNRGIVEFADILKRPVDAFKYLLVTCETGTVNVGTSIAYLDTVFIGSANELQLDAFKEYPDFMSFKARIELVRVPYLLSYVDEKKIYDIIIGKIAGSKHVTPHTTWVVSLWAVLSRLKKPNAGYYSGSLSSVMADLTPLDKVRLYTQGVVPEHLNADDKKLLKNSIPQILDEYASVPYFEGRIGASAREIKAILYDAAASPEYKTLSPLSVFKELEAFVKRTSEYEFLRQEVKDGYHDCTMMIEVVKKEYIGIIDREVRESMGLIQVTQYEEFIKKYILHVSHYLKKEKLRNPVTGQNENPDMRLIEDFEKMIEAPAGGQEKDLFRQNIISSIGAFALNNPGTAMQYLKVFPDFSKKLENLYFEKHKHLTKKIGDAIQGLDNEKDGIGQTDEHRVLAQETIRNMITRFGYSQDCAAQTILYLIKTKY